MSGAPPPQPASGSGAAAPAIDAAFVKRIAGLAKLAVSDAALPALTQQFTRILELVSKVQRIDVGGHDPATQSPIGVEDLRNDEPGPTLERRAVSGNAPQHDGAFLVVPKVLGDDEG
jgi:aspartyl-tRNA(Asn)/glutamyl-tRNA(Gln) amidotransferase subunit C